MSEEKRRRRKKSALLERAEYLVYRAFTRIVRSMSDEQAAAWGSRLGALAARILRKRNELALRNLRTVFPERTELERRAIAAGSWRHFGREVLGFVRAQTLSLAEIADRCPVRNAALLDEALARGKGVILLSAHYGSWEIGSLAVMSLVRNTLTVARPLDNALLERDLAVARERTGAQVVDRRKAARPLMKGLSENRVLALLADQAVLPREGVLVPFLGHDAWTTDGPAKMALRYGSTIVFTFCIPDGTRHWLEFEEAIRTDTLTGAERDPVTLTRRINDVLSRRIASRPELWLWMHDRWKGTGEKDAHAE